MKILKSINLFLLRMSTILMAPVLQGWFSGLFFSFVLGTILFFIFSPLLALTFLVNALEDCLGQKIANKEEPRAGDLWQLGSNDTVAFLEKDGKLHFFYYNNPLRYIPYNKENWAKIVRIRDGKKVNWRPI